MNNIGRDPSPDRLPLSGMFDIPSVFHCPVEDIYVQQWCNANKDVLCYVSKVWYLYYNKFIYLLILDLLLFRNIFSKSLFSANREENFAFLYEYHVPCIHVAYCRRFHNCLAQILSRKDWKNSRKVCKRKTSIRLSSVK